MPKSRPPNMFEINPMDETDSVIQPQSQSAANSVENEDDFKIDWIYSSIRSVMHCIHRLQAEYRSQIIFILMAIIVLILALCPPDVYTNFHSFKSVHPLVDGSNTNQDAMAKILSIQKNIESNIEYIASNFQQKVDALNNRIEVIQENIFNKLSTLDDMENIDKNVIEQIKMIQANIQTNIKSNIESNMQQKIQYIQSHIDEHKSSTTQNIQNIKNKHKILNDTISAYIGKIGKEIASLKQSIADHGSNNQQNVKLIQDNIQEIQKEISLVKPLINDLGKNQQIERKPISDDVKLAALQNQIYVLSKMQNMVSSAGGACRDKKRISGKADFTVSVSYHTDLMTSSLIEYIRMKLYYFITRRYDQNAIQPTFRSGDCTPLKYYNHTNNDKAGGYNNYIIFKLRERIFINGLTLEYIEPYLVSNATQSAPRNMSIELSKDGYHYYLYKDHHYLSYNPYTDGAEKYFNLEETAEKYKYLKLNILSNYGAEYTCIYRLQIHGKL